MVTSRWPFHVANRVAWMVLGIENPSGLQYPRHPWKRVEMSTEGSDGEVWVSNQG